MQLSPSIHASTLWPVKEWRCAIFRIPIAVSLLHDNLQSAAPASLGVWCVQAVNFETEHDAIEFSRQILVLSRGRNGLGMQVARLDGS